MKFFFSNSLRGCRTQVKLMWVTDDEGFQNDEELLQFGTIKEAIEACQETVDVFLEDLYVPQLKGADLYQEYMEQAPDLYVDAAVGEPVYVASRYARKRCLQMCSRW